MPRSLAVVLAVLLTTACAAHRTSTRDWERYQQGELAGFIRAPGEQAPPDSQLANSRPQASLQRARGEIWFADGGPKRLTMDGVIGPRPTGVMAMEHITLSALASRESEGMNVGSRAVPSGYYSDHPLAYINPARPPLGYIEPTLVVVELRGPAPSGTVRTVVTRNRSFDFGRLPDGIYTLKATTAGASTVGTIAVSRSADRDARVRISLSR